MNFSCIEQNINLCFDRYAPESLRDGKFSPRSDVWSYGVTMCEMFGHGEEPQLQIGHEDRSGQEQQVLLKAIESGARFVFAFNRGRFLHERKQESQTNLVITVLFDKH